MGTFSLLFLRHRKLWNFLACINLWHIKCFSVRNWSVPVLFPVLPALYRQNCWVLPRSAGQTSGCALSCTYPFYLSVSGYCHIHVRNLCQRKSRSDWWPVYCQYFLLLCDILSRLRREDFMQNCSGNVSPLRRSILCFRERQINWLADWLPLLASVSIVEPNYNLFLLGISAFSKSVPQSWESLRFHTVKVHNWRFVHQFFPTAAWTYLLPLLGKAIRPWRPSYWDFLCILFHRWRYVCRQSYGVRGQRRPLPVNWKSENTDTIGDMVLYPGWVANDSAVGRHGLVSACDLGSWDILMTFQLNSR